MNSTGDDEQKRAPRLSIGVPVFNGDAFLAQALDSLLAQTYQDFEIIISDNGSTDTTQQICEEFAEKDNRIRYFREPKNRGASWNFNRVFELSQGAYFKWAASDDICEPTFLARCVEVLDRDSAVVLCHAKTRKIDCNGNHLWNLPDPTDGGVKGDRPRLNASSARPYRRFLDVLLSSGWSARSFAVIRSDCIRRTRMIESHYGWEKVLMAELSLMGQFHDVPDVLFFQRVHEDAASNLQTASEKQKFLDPSNESHRTLPRLQLLQGHLSAIWRHPLPTTERILCLACVVRYVFQVTKWRQIFWRGGSNEKLAKIDGLTR